MRLTNKLNLPAALVRALSVDPYSRGNANISVTSLSSPPRQVALLNAHDDELEEDVSDRIFSLFGRAIHKILEDSADDVVDGTLTERRLYMTVPAEFGPWVVSGAMDTIDLSSRGEGKIGIGDWKTAKTDEMIYGVKAERAAQVNVYALLAKANGFPEVAHLEDVFLLRDWSKVRAARESSQPRLTTAPDPSAYPEAQVVVHEVSVWPTIRTAEYVRERTSAHQKAQMEYFQSGQDQSILPECTDEERWAKPPKWAVMKEGSSRGTLCDTKEEAEARANEKTTGFDFIIQAEGDKYKVYKVGGKRASKSYDTEDEAKRWVDSQGDVYNVVFRPSVSIRCGFYCAVSSICQQWAKLKEQINVAE